MSRRGTILVTVLALATAVVMGCGGGESSPSPTAKPTLATPTFGIESSIWDGEPSYRVQYPAGWKVEGEGADDNVMFMNPADIEDNNIPSSLVCTDLFNGPAPSSDINELFQTGEAEMAALFDDYDLHERSDTTVGGDAAVVWVYTASVEPEDFLAPDEMNLAVVTGRQIIQSKNAMLLHDGRAYMLSYIAAEGVFDERYFDWFVLGFQFR